MLTTALAVLTAAPAQAAPDTSTAPTALPGSVWGFEVDRASYRMLGPRLARRLRTHGVNALVVRPGLAPAGAGGSGPERSPARAHLLVFAPLAEERALVGRTRDRGERRLPGARARLARKPLRRLRAHARLAPGS